MIHTITIAIITIAALLCWPVTAYAYLDPGTGSLLLQGIISILATLAVSVAVGWNYIRRAISKLFSRKK